MLKSVRSKAEEKFRANQKKYEQALSEREKERKKEAEHTASLRALRLAKEAVDKEVADKAAAEAAAAKEKKKKKKK
jgi:hypothetical protein